MPFYINCKNPHSDELDRMLADIPTCPGTCIFIDIVNFTEIKYRSDIRTWARMLNNTFNFISFLNDFPNYIVKGIGDELMLYIPDEELAAGPNINDHYTLLEEIVATIFNLKNHPGRDVFLPCRVAIHHCMDAYHITFIKDHNDYYGRDIDLTARLMMKSRVNRIVLSEQFHERALAAARMLDINTNDGCLKQISVKQRDIFKGVPHLTEYRHIDV